MPGVPARSTARRQIQPPHPKQNLASTTTIPLWPVISPTKYVGDIDLFLADSVTYPMPSFWKRITYGRLHVHHIAGEHRTMIDKNHAKQLAQTLSRVVDEAEASPGT